MPTLREAAVIATGQIMDVEQLTDYDTKKPNGKRVVLATGDGYVSAKVRLEDEAGVDLSLYRNVAWVVRYGAWGGRGGQGEVTCRYERDVTPNDADKILSYSGLAAATK